MKLIKLTNGIYAAYIVNGTEELFLGVFMADGSEIEPWLGLLVKGEE